MTLRMLLTTLRYVKPKKQALAALVALLLKLAADRIPRESVPGVDIADLPASI